ncbi:MAG: DNA repair protein RecN [Chloroflexota bacterium]
MSVAADDDSAVAPVGALLELTVTDLALIERVRITFESGLNVITGETGAGKSILIDALGLALGARADTSLVRHGADAGRVEALFDRLPEPLIAIREIAASGRSTARLDDETVTAAHLADIAGPLVEIHGQHDQQRLLDGRHQRELLDGYGGHLAERAAMHDADERWRSNRAALTELAIDPRELGRRIELLDHEAAEIAAARLRPGEAEEIRERLRAAQHGEAIVRGGAAAVAALSVDAAGATGGTGAREAGAREALAVAVRETRGLARLDARFALLVARLEGLDAELADVTAEFRTLAGTVDHDAGTVEQLEGRLSLIYGLERRYGEDEASVIAHGERVAAESARLADMDGERARRAALDAELLGSVAAAAATLSGFRAAAADRLAGEVGAILEDLGFPRGVFDVALGRRPAGPDQAAIELGGDAVAFDGTGADEVVFRIAPNPGEPARPLERIASGGELSRVALAAKQVLAAADATPTIVFDEVDAGIGGRSADPIGRNLWLLARRHRVLVVTHLPQIAAHADVHFRISKSQRDGRTVTDVERLDRDGRIAELAEMLGGETAQPGPAAVASARELLDRAEGWRERVPAGA